MNNPEYVSGKKKKKKTFTTESTSNTIQLGSFSAQETETHVLY